jgi:AcrR family transcriptional regulator
MFGNANAVCYSGVASPAPRRDRRAQRRDATRLEILGAAWALARESGLAALSMRDLASRVGLQAPSLYSYFASKNDIYDAMFAQGYREYDVAMAPVNARFDAAADLHDAVDALRAGTHAMFDFSVADPVRFQLLFQRTIPGFEPSPESYAVAMDSLTSFSSRLATLGVGQSGLDVFTAVLSGLVSQQLANDPGGDRWARLVDDVVDMLVAHLLPVHHSDQPRKSQQQQRGTP